MIRRIANRIVWILVFITTMTVVVWSNIKQANTPCPDITVIMSKVDYPVLSSPEIIKTNVLENTSAIIGKSIKNIEIEKLEDFLAMDSHLSQVKAYLNVNGYIHIKVKPRQGILRVFDKNGANLYLGKDNVLMDNSPTLSQRILVASGFIESLSPSERISVLKGEEELPDIYKQLYQLATQIQEDEFLEALIDQIYVNKNQEVELTPKIGVKTIYFGKLDKIEDKLFKLKALYIQGKNSVDWNKYRSINLKFRNQIVCSKK